MQSSKTTISTSFFDNLWPLILEENVCNIESKNTKEFFIPQRKFDHIWAHSLLASKNFQNYEKPIKLKCEKDEDKSSEEGKQNSNGELLQMPYKTPVPAILPLDQQLALIQNDVEIRQKLANDFANRKFPWYIQRPSYEYNFTITEEMKKQFKEQLEYEILHNIQLFECHVMIIDLAQFVGLKYLERWHKFSPYVSIIIVVHDPDVFRQLKNFGNSFLPVQFEENLDNTWQVELNRSMKIGVNHAKRFNIFNDRAKAFAFVFSNNRGICVWDNFKILRKS